MIKKALAWINKGLKRILAVTGSNTYLWVQWCHFSIAWMAVTGSFFFCYFRGHWWVFYLTVGLGYPLVAIKEIFIDPRDEVGHNGPDWDDLTSYTLGAIAAGLWIAYLLHRS